MPRGQRHHGGPPAHILVKQAAQRQKAAERRTAIAELARTAAAAKVAPVHAAAVPSVTSRQTQPPLLPRALVRRPTSVPSIARASRPQASRPQASLPQHRARLHIRRSSARERAAAAAVLLPFAILGAVLALRPPTERPAGATIAARQPSFTPEIAQRFAESLPPLRWPAAAPEIAQPGSIQFAALAWPLSAPDVPPPALVPVIIPALPFARAETLPDALLQPGSIEFAALLLPTVPPEIVATRTDAAERLATATLDQCQPTTAPVRTLAAPSSTANFSARLAAAASAQIGDLAIYNARYTRIAYPGGDVPTFYGVCTDVVIRAYRALGIDLQEIVHLARIGNGDTSIDHRRTETLRRFFAIHGESVAVSEFAEDYRPGDIVTYYRPQNKSSTAHIAIVSDVIAPSGRPMIIHNRGFGVQREDALFVDKLTGHYRYTGPRPAAAPLTHAVAPTSSGGSQASAASKSRVAALRLAARPASAPPVR